MPSKTQEAFERYLAGDKSALDVLTGMAIRKCGGLHVPFSQDGQAKNKFHAWRRRQTHRYVWIYCWLKAELRNPRPDDTGARLMTRCRWRLLDEIRKEYSPGPREPSSRVRREKLPSREHLLSMLEKIEPPADPILRDLWERIVAAYPDWRLGTNRHLAAVLGVHPNAVASRRHALAAGLDVTHDQAELLKDCLRLRVGKVRKTDIRKMEASWPELHRPLEGKALPKARCEYLDPDTGRRCVYVQALCPLHRKSDVSFDREYVDV